MKVVSLSSSIIWLAAAPAVLAQHGHLNAGAAGPDGALIWHNGNIFAAESGYVQEMLFQTEGAQAGFFSSGPTLTALPQTVINGGPVLGAPSLGSFIQVRFESLEGPAGAHFGFWEEGATEPTISVESGGMLPSLMWALSDASLGAGEPGADPYGHLHGRRFAADAAGFYTVGFRLYDTSDNGPDGGPIHDPSEILYMNFLAVPEPSTWALALLGLTGMGAVWWRARRKPSGAVPQGI